MQTHYLHVILISTLVESSRAVVDCRTACTKCKDRLDEYKFLEIYCSMCKECRDSRKKILELKKSEVADEEESENVSYPSGCPTPPPCYSDDSDNEPVAIKITTPTTTATTTTTTTTTKPPCPSIPPCHRKKKHMRTTPCMPCMPLCWAPCPGAWPQVQQAAPAAEATTLSTVTDPDYFYVYIGVPKGVMSNEATTNK